MRRKKMYLAAILAAVMALQAPMIVFADDEPELSTEEDLEEPSDVEEGADGEEDEDGKWEIHGDVTITDDSWSSTDPENPTAVDEEGVSLKNVSAWDGYEVTVNGDVDSTVSKPVKDEEGNDYLPQPIDAGKGGVITVNGDVSSENTGVIWVDDGTVTITGDAASDAKDVAAVSVGENGGTVKVGGDVVSQNAPAVETNSKADISVEGDVEGTEGVIITIGSDGGGTVEILGTVTATGEVGSAIVINTSLDDKDAILAQLPQIVVGSLETKSGEGDLWIGGENNENVSDEVYEAVYEQILYYIAQNKLDNATLSVSGAKEEYENQSGWAANEKDSLTVTIKADDGYEVSSVSGTDVVKNDDGAYTVVVQRGKGIDINAVIKAIVKANSSSSNQSEDSATVVVIPAYATAQKQFQTAIADQIKALSSNGTLKIDMKDCISFNRKTFEALAQRNDVDIEICYTWQGKKYRVVIPAGYDILSLLDTNGYCGCLYLNSIFGSTEVLP